MKAWEKFKAAKSFEDKKKIYEEVNENVSSYEERRLIIDAYEMVMNAYFEGKTDGILAFKEGLEKGSLATRIS